MREAEARDRSIAAYDVLDGAPRRELDSLVQLAAQVAGGFLTRSLRYQRSWVLVLNGAA